MGDERIEKKRLVLCLSGGGLRATLFHLGVVKALRTHQLSGKSALQTVDEVYSVSGGSILAAHMLVNWSRYTDPDDNVFAQVEREILKFAASNIRDRILRRWFLTGWLGGLHSLCSRLPFVGGFFGKTKGLFSRTYWLQTQYESRKFVGKKGIGEATARPETHPQFHFLATSFKTGELCSFSGDRFEIEARDGQEDQAPQFAPTPCGHLRLSLAVAASSAFPPMFPPIELTDDQLANPNDEKFLTAISLSDGGVYDNLGIEKFRRNWERQDRPPTRLIISDAGGSFRTSAENNYGNVVARNVRASDILMHRIGDKLKADIKALDNQIIDDVTIRISDTVRGADVSEAVQQRLRLVRTDLDRFDGKLADMLVRHGERLAKASIPWLPVKGESEMGNLVSPTSAETEALDAILQRAANRSFRSLMFGRDWTTPIFLPAFLALLLSLPVAIGFGAWTYVKNAQLATQKTVLAKQKTELASGLQQDIQNAGTVFAELRDKCLERNRVCSRLDYEKLADKLHVALNEARQAVNVRLPQRNTDTKANVGASIPTEPPTAISGQQTIPHRQKIYVQFAGLIAREKVKLLYNDLRKNGWAVQGNSGERVPSAYGLNEVRYSGGEENKMAAIKLAEAVQRSSIAGADISVNKLDIIQPDVLEVWISR